MKTCKELRLENARELAAGKSAELAKRLSATQEEPFSSQQANAIIGPNPNRPIGDSIARRIEVAYGKEVGWLDHDHTSMSLDPLMRGDNNVLSVEATELIMCVAQLDGVGELARQTFVYARGILQLSAASAELQTGSARSQMLADTEGLLLSRLGISGAAHEFKPKK